jgi:hypothetical protein
MAEVLGKNSLRARLSDGTPLLATAFLDGTDKSGSKQELRAIETLYPIPGGASAFDLVLNDVVVFRVDLKSLPGRESLRGKGGNLRPAPQATEKGKRFTSTEIAFDYPEAWASWPKESFEKMQAAAKAMGGIDLLALINAPDLRRLCQIVRNRNPASFESLLREKKKVADQVTSEGIEIMGQRYVKYSVTVVTIVDGREAVLASAEKSNGEIGMSYTFLSGGYEYNVNFIYLNATDAVKGEKYRSLLLGTLKIRE